MRLALLLAQGARDAKRKVPDVVEEKLKVLCMEMGANSSREWDPESMARRIGLSLPQFNRRFRALAGTSAARYLILRRVDRARLLLRETTMSLQEIAASLGYRDIYYFHRQFRAEAGSTPASFRRNPGRRDD
jgi:transcriptional regulator GlxA family with amidase domain